MKVRQIISCMESKWKTSPSKFPQALFTNIRAKCTPPECWRHRSTQMGAAIAHWSVLGTLSVPLWQRGTCVESYHWVSESTVSRSLWQRCYHRAVYRSRYNPTKLGEYCQTLLRNVHHIRCRFGRHLVEWHTQNGSVGSDFRSLFCYDWSSQTSQDYKPRVSYLQAKLWDTSNSGFQGR